MYRGAGGWCWANRVIAFGQIDMIQSVSRKGYYSIFQRIPRSWRASCALLETCALRPKAENPLSVRYGRNWLKGVRRNSI